MVLYVETVSRGFYDVELKLAAETTMLHLKPGELVALEHGGRYYVFLVLSPSAFFGCQWTFALHRTFLEPPLNMEIDLSTEKGFVALIDFIKPRRANAVIRIRKGIETTRFLSFDRTKALIREPDGTALWFIYDRNSRILKKVPSLSKDEMDYPIWSGMHAEDAFELIDGHWNPRILVSGADSGQYPRTPKHGG